MRLQVHALAHAVELLGIGLIELDELLGEAVELLVLQSRHTGHLCRQRLLQLTEIAGQLLARTLRTDLQLRTPFALAAFGQILLVPLQFGFQ